MGCPPLFKKKIADKRMSDKWDIESEKYNEEQSKKSLAWDFLADDLFALVGEPKCAHDANGLSNSGN